MTFPGFTRYLTGILVPVSAIRREGSLGIGEFSDLPRLARWCADVGVDMIQILPVNDTGWQASPYSALSAFALHPLYLTITDLPEYESLPKRERADIDARLEFLRNDHGYSQRINYGKMLDDKTAIIRLVYDAVAGSEALRRAVRAFVDRNPWAGEYAAYKMFKARFGGASWKEWPEYRDPTPELLGSLWSDPQNEVELTFHVWLQMRLDEQFTRAAQEMNRLGVMLNGDLPILINEDSVDTWAHRRYFSARYRVGAPPDGENPLGQNWGLPAYDWHELERDGYRWWKERLLQARRYYTAYRIDHVLGFFRVWSIAAGNASGYLGHFQPCAVATRDRLHDAGMDDARIRWLAEPHLRGDAIRDAVGDDADEVIRVCLEPVENQDLYTFAPSIRGELDLASHGWRDETREWLLWQYRDRALIRLDGDTFVPAWTYGNCSRFHVLSDDEKNRFSRLAAELAAESERLWNEQARRLLGFMRETTDMLPCAEDLGSIPPGVPEVLGDLRILGLRIPRWSRIWHEPGQPYIPPTEYPFLSVCAPSVHDTSTIRGWWNEERDHYAFWKALGLPGDAPREYDPDAARKVVEALLEASSAICVFQLQDLFALVDGMAPPDPATERVNVPGTMDERNWAYRIPFTVAEIAHRHELAAVLSPMLADRRRRALAGGA